MVNLKRCQTSMVTLKTPRADPPGCWDTWSLLAIKLQCRKMCCKNCVVQHKLLCLNIKCNAVTLCNPGIEHFLKSTTLCDKTLRFNGNQALQLTWCGYNSRWCDCRGGLARVAKWRSLPGPQYNFETFSKCKHPFKASPCPTGPFRAITPPQNKSPSPPLWDCIWFDRACKQIDRPKQPRQLHNSLASIKTYKHSLF